MAWGPIRLNQAYNYTLEIGNVKSSANKYISWIWYGNVSLLVYTGITW